MSEELIHPRDGQEMLKELGRLSGYADGNYYNKCRDCNQKFIGDKRAYQCLPCAATSILEVNSKHVERIKELEAELKAWQEHFTVVSYDGESIVWSG